MEDPDTQAALGRVADKNLWTVGWFLCAVVTLTAVAYVVEDWHLRHLAGKLTASTMVVFLILFPTLVALKGRKRISVSWFFFAAYLL